MAKRLLLPGFTVLLGIIIFIVFYAFSDGASNLQASYPPFSYPDPVTGPTGTAASAAKVIATNTSSPMLFVPGMHKSAIGSPQKGLAWVHYWGPDPVRDAYPFNISWYHNWSLWPPATTQPLVPTVGGEFVPFLGCMELLSVLDPDDPSTYPASHPFLSKAYTGYLLFLNEPDNEAKCGAILEPNNVISATEVYSKIVAVFPNAKLIGPNLTWQLHSDETITGFLEEWRTRVITMGLPLPHGYGIHLYPKPLGDNAENWTQAYCDKLYEWGELDKELWVTEFGWQNDWVLGETDEERQAFMYTRVAEEFGFFEDGLAAGTPTPGAEPNCQITRYAWYTNRITDVIPAGTPTPTATPTIDGIGYTDLYWYWSLTRSYTGNAYVDFGKLETPTPTPIP